MTEVNQKYPYRVDLDVSPLVESVLMSTDKDNSITEMRVSKITLKDYVKSWMDDNVGGYEVHRSLYPRYISFDDENAALLFKMTFG